MYLHLQFKPHAFQATLNKYKMKNCGIFFVIIIFVLFFFIEFCEAEKAGIVFVKMEKDEEKIDF